MAVDRQVTAAGAGGVGGSIFAAMQDGALLTVEELKQARCRDYTLGIVEINGEQQPFHPEHDEFFDSGAEITARMICKACPIRQRCLIVALERKEPHGVFGGATVQNRESLLRKMYRKGLTAEQVAVEFDAEQSLKDAQHYSYWLESKAKKARLARNLGLGETDGPEED